MKFFSKLGSCYRASTSAAASHQEEDDGAINVAPLPSSRHHAERKKKLGGGSASSVARHWRPGLKAIREEGIVLDWEGKVTERSAHSENKSKGRHASKPQRVSHNDDPYSRNNNNNSTPMIIPAFAPTPFMF
ncbi:hypothetical protein DITRI_Ditri01bG0109700 [Diplodiscus trichospermus]